MEKIRIGKDITIKMSVQTNGEPVSLDGRDISVVLKTPILEEIKLSFTSSDNTITSMYEGTKHKYCGVYMLTVWENYGKIGQTALDFCNAFELVKTTCEESPSSEGLETETVELEGEISVGLHGASAYEIAVENGFQGTEEEWLESLKGKDGKDFTYSDFTPEQIAELQRPAAEAAQLASQAASKANAAAQSATEAATTAAQTEASIEQSEALRVTAEKQREANETFRQSAETARKQAESVRASAEQTRVLAEQSRVAAEQGRVSAEQSRVTEFAILKQESETATTNANEAAKLATDAASNVPNVDVLICSTPATTSAKEVTMPGFVLGSKTRLLIKMNNMADCENTTLTVNNSAGSAEAKPLMYNGRRASINNTWVAGGSI